MLNSSLLKFADLFSGYTELRVQENRTLTISLVNGNLVTNSFNTSSGVSARSYYKGYCGFASSSELSDEAIKMVIIDAQNNAKFLNTKNPKNKGNWKVKNGNANNIFGNDNNVKNQKEKIEFLIMLDNFINEKYPNLSSRSLYLQVLEMEKNLFVSTNAASHSLIPRIIIRISMSIDNKGEPTSNGFSIGELGYFEDALKNISDIYTKIDNLYQQLIDKSEGVYAKAGMQTCILDAGVAGILAHEAVGHTTEADLVLSGSVAGDYMHQMVASPLITLIDFAHTAYGKTCPVPVWVDDEGTEAQDTMIIKNGILTNFMHNKETANHFNAELTGNARAFAFYDEPLVRMRNTAILSGNSKLSEMIASVDNGYYLIKSSNGQADSTSEFMFGIVLGYEIVNGKLAKAIKDTTISGVAFDLLKTVSAVSDDFTWECSGMCGKKQSIPVGMGGPAIKCLVNIGGK